MSANLTIQTDSGWFNVRAGISPISSKKLIDLGGTVEHIINVDGDAYELIP